MRSRPATRIAFACVNSPPPFPPAASCFVETLQNNVHSMLAPAAGASALKSAAPLIALCWLQSRHARPFSEEAATPGYPQRLHALGTARQFTLVNCRRTNPAQSLAA